MAAVLSGNRNFEGRINPQVKANYLASPPLVVAYALAGHHRYRSDQRPAGQRFRGQAGLPARHLADQRRGAGHRARVDRPRACSEHEYAQAFDGDANWQSMPVPTGDILPVGRAVHLHQEAALFRQHGGPGNFDAGPGGMRVLALLGDSVTTDHISPAGSIRQGQPGGPLSDRAGRAAEGFQLLRRAARQSRSDGARHAGQHPAAQPARAGHRGRLDACICRMASRCTSTTPR